jgi:hypothetical protein
MFVIAEHAVQIDFDGALTKPPELAVVVNSGLTALLVSR